MRATYRVLAYTIATLVVVQAAVIAAGMFGIMDYLDGGGTLNSSALDSGRSVPVWGFVAHGIIGTIVIPLVAIALVVVSFLARLDGGVRWALILFGVVALQIALAFLSGALSGLGVLHGANALVLFGLAVSAAMRVRRDDSVVAARPVPADTVSGAAPGA
jgi:heme A synthase